MSPQDLQRALLDTLAHLDAATSAYEKYAKRHPSVGKKAATDPFFTTRLEDFKRAIARNRAILLEAQKPGSL